MVYVNFAVASRAIAIFNISWSEYQWQLNVYNMH